MVKAIPLTILIVDDEEDMRFILKSILDSKGYTTYVAANGRQALEACLRISIDAIISDVRMPDMDGVELLQKVREKWTKIPVVFLTTGYADINEEQALALGANGLVSKPFDINTILVAIQVAVSNALKESA